MNHFIIRISDLNRLEMKNKASFNQLGIFAAGNVINTLIAAISSIILARWVSPEIFGEFKKYGILANYSMIGLILVHDALWRQYPYLIGKGEANEALQTAAAAKWWYLLVSNFFSVIFIIISINSLIRGDFKAFIGWCVQVSVVWNNIYNAYLMTLFRTSFDFKRLTTNNLVANIVGFILLLLVKQFGFWGLCLRTVLQNVLIIYLNSKYIPVKIKAIYTKDRLLALAKISIPISIPGYLHTSFLSATITFLVLKYLGEKNLGIFITSNSLIIYCTTIASSIQQYISPQLNQSYGANSSFYNCIKLSVRPMFVSVISSIIICIIIYFSVSPIIKLLAPNYRDAGIIVQILSITIIMTSLELPFVTFYTTLENSSSAFLAIIKTLATIMFIVVWHSNLINVAIDIVLGELLRVILGYIMIFIKLKKEKQC